MVKLIEEGCVLGGVTWSVNFGRGRVSPVLGDTTVHIWLLLSATEMLIYRIGGKNTLIASFYFEV